MKFELFPVLSLMEKIYHLPIGQDRFRAYLKMLNGGNKDILAAPVGAYNPMAKEVVLHKLLKMKELGAEDVASNVLLAINDKLEGSEKVIKVGLNLVDDLGGSWSNKFQTKFESIFKFNGVFNYDFCTPYFWMSEEITENLIRKRTMAYAWRTVFWLQNGKPQTLADHLNQEVFVSEKFEEEKVEISEELEKLKLFFDKNKQSTDLDLIFNFFFGDRASVEFGYATFGVGELTGFDLARFVLSNSSSIVY